MLGYGLVGCGRVSARHIDAVEGTAGARVVAVTDPEREKVARAMDRCGGDVACYADYRELLDDPAVDVVVVLAPTQMHPEIAVAALESGRHVYCEKAMAASVAGCRRMIEARDRSGMKLTVGQSTRFRPPFAMARRLIEDGAVGEIVAIDGAFSGPANTPEQGATDSWRYRKESAGNGHVINFGCHYIDTARFLCGQDPTSVGAVIRNRFSPGMIQEDQFVITCECDGGALIDIAMYCTPEPIAPTDEGFSIYGTDGFMAARWRPDRVTLVRRGHDPESIAIAEDLRRDPFLVLHRAFRQAIETDTPVPVTGEDALRNVEWGMAAYLSSQRRAWMDLPLPDDMAEYRGPQLDRTLPATRT